MEALLKTSCLSLAEEKRPPAPATKAKTAASVRLKVGVGCTYRFRARAVVPAASRTVNEKPTQRELDALCARGSSAPEENVCVRKIESRTSWKYKLSHLTGQTFRWVGSSSPRRRPQPFWRLGGTPGFEPPPPRWSQSTQIGKRVQIGDRLIIRSLCEKGKLRFFTLLTSALFGKEQHRLLWASFKSLMATRYQNWGKYK